MEMDGIETNGTTSQPTTTATATTPKERPPVTINKPIPYTFDLGHLTIFDENLLPTTSLPNAAEIHSVARDCAQALINQILTTLPISHSSKDGTLIKLPAPTTPLPREKPLPAPKQETKWEKFAKKKGIVGGKGKDGGRGGKMVFDEEKQEWVPKWGYKGRNKDGDGQWLVEVDEKKEGELKEGETVRGMGRRERVENVRRNERKQRANDRRGRTMGA